MSQGNGNRERGSRKRKHSHQVVGNFESLSELLKVYDDHESESDSGEDGDGEYSTDDDDEQDSQKQKLKKLLKSKFNTAFLKSEFCIGYKLGILRKKLDNNILTPKKTAKKVVKLYDKFIYDFLATENEILLEKVYNTEFSRDELIHMSSHMKDKLSEIISDEQEPLYKRVMAKLSIRYPDHDFKTHRKHIKNFLKEYPSNIDINIATDMTTAELLCQSNDLTNGKDTSEPPEFQEFPLVAPEEGKYHDFESPESHHYYIASSQYYKMLLHTPHSNPKNPISIQNKPNSIQSIEHIVNKKTLDSYNQMKNTFKELGKVTENKKVRELLLFHSTDAKNIDSILQNGFNINHNPHHKEKKMIYGRGVYFSEHPEYSYRYGNKILLCKVLPGNVERLEMTQQMPPEVPMCFDSRQLSRNCIGYIHVIKDARQILPYCVINLTNGRRGGQTQESLVMPGPSGVQRPNGVGPASMNVAPQPGPSGMQNVILVPSGGQPNNVLMARPPPHGPSGMQRPNGAGPTYKNGAPQPGPSVIQRPNGAGPIYKIGAPQPGPSVIQNHNGTGATNMNGAPQPGPSGIQHPNGVGQSYMNGAPQNVGVNIDNQRIVIRAGGNMNNLATQSRQNMMKYIEPMMKKIREDPVKWRSLHSVAKTICRPVYIDTENLEKLEAWIKKHVMDKK